MSKARPRWFLPWWIRRHHERKAKAAALRARDGDDCWRCGHPMRFVGVPNCGKAATIEHLMPRAQGGTSALANLRLCHIGCNRHLADHPPAQKERMRINLPRACS
jgi:5-methylcytosine-specific restriction endonuclease McrA